MRMAVIGCGRIGRMHAANIRLHPETVLATVFDEHGPSAERTAAANGCAVASSAEEIFASPDVDAVLVASITETHADYIERSVVAGKPVLCEKPIDLDLDRVNACAAVVAGSRVPVQIGFNRRFDPGHRAARDAAANGDIGALHQVVITSRDPGMPPRSYYESAGGLLRDMTIHDFDLARFMLGDEPTEVMAVAGRLIDPAMMDELDDHDTAMIILTTADGKQCHINNSRTSTYGYDQRVELLGSEGLLSADNMLENTVSKATRAGVTSGKPEFFFLERYMRAYAAEWAAFVEAVTKGGEVPVTLRDGISALAMAEAATESARTGAPVAVVA